MRVTYYQNPRGDIPVRDFLETLQDQDHVKVKSLIAYLSEAITLREPHAKKIIGYPGLFELRPGAYRIFYCYHEGMIVLLHAFRKKSNKTPAREIETAYSRMRSWEV